MYYVSRILSLIVVMALGTSCDQAFETTSKTLDSNSSVVNASNPNYSSAVVNGRSISNTDRLDDILQIENLTERFETLEELILENLSIDCSGSEECVSIPGRIKSCGGALYFLNYSNSSTDLNNISSLLNHYRLTNDILNEGMMSTCEVIEPPTLSCINNKCIKDN